MVLTNILLVILIVVVIILILKTQSHIVCMTPTNFLLVIIVVAIVLLGFYIHDTIKGVNDSIKSVNDSVILSYNKTQGTYAYNKLDDASLQLNVSPCTDLGNCAGSGSMVWFEGSINVFTDRHLFLEEVNGPDGFCLARDLVSVYTRDGTNIFDLLEKNTVNVSQALIFYSEDHDAAYVRLISSPPKYKPLEIAEEKDIWGGQTLYGSSLREGELSHMQGIILDFGKNGVANANTQGSHGYSGACLGTIEGLLAANHVGSGKMLHFFSGLEKEEAELLEDFRKSVKSCLDDFYGNQLAMDDYLSDLEETFNLTVSFIKNVSRNPQTEILLAHCFKSDFAKHRFKRVETLLISSCANGVEGRCGKQSESGCCGQLEGERGAAAEMRTWGKEP